MPKPIKRWKSRIRVLGRARKNYLRFYPNFGFQVGRLHYCRSHGWRKHRKP